MIDSAKGKEARMSKQTETTAQAIGAYFAACDATRERIPLKNGGFEERQIPYTLFGLARAAKTTPEALIKIYREPKRTAKDRLLFDAVLKVAAYTQERALLGELTYQVALESLRSIGDAGVPEEGQTLHIVMDERLKGYAK
jgi:hypothetical protein